MVVLIASHRSALLIYCLPPSYNFIFTTEYKFSNGFRTALDGGYSIIFSPINLLCIKNSPVNLDTWLGALLYFEITRLELVQCKGSLIHKITIVSTVEFNSFIEFERSNYCLIDNSSLCHHTNVPLLVSFSPMHVWIGLNPFFAPSVSSRFVDENYFRKLNFMCFMVKFRRFKIFALIRKGCLENFFTDPNL